MMAPERLEGPQTAEARVDMKPRDEAPFSINPQDDWPTLVPTALHGLAGDVVRLIEPHTESDPVAILSNLLLMFGSAVGRAPHARVGAARHGTNEFVVQVGDSSRGRKGTAFHEVQRILLAADPDYCKCVAGGLSTGEGLIHAVRDRTVRNNRKGEEIIEDSGVDDKRLLALEPEFASVLRVASREGNTLSETLRKSWDGDDLRTLTKNSPQRASSPHISMVAHVTNAELLKELSQTNQANGFANRFLFLCVRRSKLLPHGGSLDDSAIVGIAERVESTIKLARDRGRLERDDEANKRWEDAYPELTSDRNGMLGAIVARAEAHVLRLSLIYALLDNASSIQLPHLDAALALWQYAEESAVHVFGGGSGDLVAERICAALRDHGPKTQSELADVFKRHLPGVVLNRTLTNLESEGKISSEQVKTEGRPRVVWTAR